MTLLATGVNNKEHIAEFDAIAKERFEGLDLTPLFVYMIDTVPAAVLPALAAQFDLLGYKGWKLATTEQAQRDLIKQGIALHAYKGTPYGIKQAVKAIGFFDAIITEGGTIHLYDGSSLYDGTIGYSSIEPAWAVFSVEFDLGNYVGITESQIEDIIGLVMEYKNVRSWLSDVRFKSTFQEDLYITDEFTMTIEFADFVEDLETCFYYDGRHTYNGQYNYDNPHEKFTFVTVEEGDEFFDDSFFDSFFL